MNVCNSLGQDDVWKPLEAISHESEAVVVISTIFRRNNLRACFVISGELKHITHLQTLERLDSIERGEVDLGEDALEIGVFS